MLQALLVLWFLRLFKPEWLVAFYVPALGPLKSIPTVILYGMVAYLLFWKTSTIRVDWPFTIYLFCVAVSTIFAENTGLGRKGFQGVFDNFLFFAVNMSLLSQKENLRALDTILTMYVLSFVVYGIVGITHKGIVPYHVYLDDEDFFGPFMDIGVAVSLIAAYQTAKPNRFYLMTGVISIVGVIASFARGAFLSFCATGLYIWWRSANRIKNAIVLLIAAVFTVSVTFVLFPENAYWKEMATIGTSLQDEKSEGRHFLIQKGFEIFALYPVLGVGPLNYGFMIPKITSEAEAQTRGMHAAQYATRVAHNIYIQILAELGAIGSIAFTGLIFAFWFRSLKVRRFYEQHVSKDGMAETDASRQEQWHKMLMFGFAFEAAMVGYLLNGIFYPILFCPWFYDLLILNALVFRYLEVEAKQLSQSTQRAFRVPRWQWSAVKTKSGLTSRGYC